MERKTGKREYGKGKGGEKKFGGLSFRSRKFRQAVLCAALAICLAGRPAAALGQEEGGLPSPETETPVASYDVITYEDPGNRTDIGENGREDLADREEPSETVQAAQTDFEAGETDGGAIDAAADEDTYEEQPVSTPSIPLSAGEAGRGDVEDLDKYWAMSGYPDFVSFAYEAGGEMAGDGTVISWWEIGVTDAGDEERQQILELAAETCRITFRECVYSYEQRNAVMEEIRARDDEHIRTVFLGQNNESVFVLVDQGFLEDYTESLTRQYGFLVQVLDEAADTDGEDSKDKGVDLTVPLPGKGGSAAGGGIAYGYLMLLWAAAAVLGLMLFTIRLRRGRMAVTPEGKYMTSRTALSRRTVVRVVKESGEEPSRQVWDEICRQVKK